MLVPEADGVVIATMLTQGPWDPDSQYGGTPAALLTWAVEGVPTLVPMRIARITVDMHRRVPLGRLVVHTEVVRGLTRRGDELVPGDQVGHRRRSGVTDGTARLGIRLHRELGELPRAHALVGDQRRPHHQPEPRAAGGVDGGLHPCLVLARRHRSRTRRSVRPRRVRGHVHREPPRRRARRALLTAPRVGRCDVCHDPRVRRRLRKLAFVVVASVLPVVVLANVAAAGNTDESVSTRRVTSAIDWRPCSRDQVDAGPDLQPRLQCARVVVPVDYDYPDGRTLSLFVARRLSAAPDPLGPLFVNQGGPGFEAAQYAAALGTYGGLDRFDLIGMDPRGTGRSTPIRCRKRIPDFSSTASGAPTERYRDAIRGFVEGCAEDQNVRFFGSNNVARDMDRVRELLGVEKISYFGKSYGSDLGTAYLGLFPNHVRAAVLDGATDLTIDPAEFYAQQTQAGLRAFDRYLDHCRVDACAWTRGDDPLDAWNAVVRRIGESPVKDPDSGERLTDADLRTFQYKSFGDASDLDDALDALVLRDDPSALLPQPADDDEARALEANVVITCLDMPIHDFAAAFDRYRKLVDHPNPDGTSVIAACSQWPKPADPITVARVPDGTPVMVVSTRGDVPTPYESGVGLAQALGVPVLTWEANSHTAYLFSPCVQDLANRLLVDLQPLPPEGTTCPDDRVVDVAPLTEATIDET
jgi:pimeloyl-ACP methyl ester carboxylesterase